MVTARQALTLLKDGNKRFVAERGRDAPIGQTRRSELTERQEPFAIVLGCSDSRVPAEIVFDQGLGDLFVIRVAGNIVAPSQIGSVEFAAERFGTRLVVVLGHSRLRRHPRHARGAAPAAREQSRNLQSIVDRVRPSVEALLATELRQIRRAGRRGRARQRARLGEPPAARLRDPGGADRPRRACSWSGAEYSLESGVVEFFDGVPNGV